MSSTQSPLFDESVFITSRILKKSELIPCADLLSVFEECHNYIYANNGALKDAIFREIVKLIIAKIYDEKTLTGEYCRFFITAEEYQSVISNGASEKFKKRMRNLYSDVQKSSNYSMWSAPASLSWSTVAYVVGKLQKFDLSNTPADVAGYAFQTFIHHYQRGGRGEYFTPYPIVRLAIQMIQPNINEKIIDPACGSGGFLTEAMRYMKHEKIEVESDFEKVNISGIEFNPDIALSAKLLLEMEGGRSADIKCANAFDCDEFDGKYDVVLTNPPFGNKGKITDSSILNKFDLGKRVNKDDYEYKNEVLLPQAPEILFIEKSINLLRPGGRVAIVLPEGILHNFSSKFVRSWVERNAIVKAVVSLPQETFVPFGTGIKTSLLVLQKKVENEVSKHIFFCKMNKLGYDVKGQAVYKRDDAGHFLYDNFDQKIIDDDVEEIKQAYCSKKFRIKNERMWFADSKNVKNRWDAEHYDPSDIAIIHSFNNASRLGDLVEVVRKRDVAGLSAKDVIRYIAISNVDYRFSHITSYQIMALHELPSRASYLLCEGDIITAVSGASTGTESHATALVTESESGAVCSNGFAVLRGVKLVNPLYLFAYIQTNYFLRQVKRLRTGTAIPAITLDDLCEILVPIPSPSLQKDVANQMEKIINIKKQVIQKTLELTSFMKENGAIK